MRINGTTSKELDVFSGVPQGSILGSLFLLVFINDLTSCVMSKEFGYADDYKIVGTNPVTLNIDVRKLWRLCENNLMSMNLTKSKLQCIKGSVQLYLRSHPIDQRFRPPCERLFKLDLTREEKNRKSLECILPTETKP